MSYGYEDMWGMDPTGFCPECGIPEYGMPHDHRPIIIGGVMTPNEARAILGTDESGQ